MLPNPDRTYRIQTGCAGLLSLPLLVGSILTVGSLSDFLLAVGSLSFSWAVAGWFLLRFSPPSKE